MRTWNQWGLAALGLAGVVGLAFAVGGAMDAPAGEPAPAPAPREPSLGIYLGKEPRTVESRSEVRGAHGSYRFEPALQGDLVRHDFFIHNPVGERLQVEKLRMCSNCAVVNASKVIEPNGLGRLTMVIPTDPLGGRTIESPIVIETDSESLPTITIDVHLEVREFAALSPYRVWLEGTAEEEIVETCLVVPNEAYPFEVTGIRARRGTWFTHSFEEVEHEGGRAWRITIRNTRTRPGPYQDVLFVQTDHPERPELKVRIEGRIGGSADGSLPGNGSPRPARGPG
ncbi:MAG: hypothetical protein ACQGVC_22885 [Myxococcota bacterium]